MTPSFRRVTNPKYFVSMVSGLAVVLFASFSARAEELPKIDDTDLNHAVYSEGPSTIPGLTWAGEDGKPNFSIEGVKGRPAARVNGRFTGKNAGTLLFTSQSIQRVKYLDDAGNFSVLIPLIARKTPVKVQYIDDYGNLKAQNIEIVYEGYAQYQLDESKKKRVSLDVGASVSYLAYTQGFVGADAGVKISEIGVTPKIGTTWNISSKLDLGASAFMTALPLPLSKTPDGLSTPRFYGVNLRLGYKFYGLKTGNIYLMTGPYLWGMIIPPSSNGVTYGVVHLSGPQLFLVGRFLTKSGRTAVGYIKAASILDGVGGMSQNHEYAIGGAYQITPASKPRRIMANLDIASASFVIDPDNPNFIKLFSVSLGLSTSF